jgi:hypothetical protein
MSDCSKTTSRIQKLRELRKSLCEKERARAEAVKARDWFVSELCELKKIADEDNSTVSDLKSRISNMLSILESDTGDRNE